MAICSLCIAESLNIKFNLNVVFFDKLNDVSYSTKWIIFFPGKTHRSLIEDKVCRFMAIGLLRPCDKFNLSDFKIAWQGSVPEGKH